jgi:hypothetical protein
LRTFPATTDGPFIGHTLVLLGDPKGFVERRAARYGLIYRSRAFGQSNISVGLCAPR